jgi:hypothetical protein
MWFAALERGISVDVLEEEQQNAEKRLKAIEDISPDLDAGVFHFL